MVNDYRLPGDVSAMQVLNHVQAEWFNSLCVAASSQEFAFAVLALVLTALIIRQRERAWRGVIVLAATIAATDGFGSQVLKPWFGRTRPCFADPEHVRMLAPIADTGSLPSLHAANSFAVLAVIAFLFPRLAVALAPIAILISLSRIVVGVHWLSDVLAGALYGAVVGLTMALIGRRLRMVHVEARSAV